MVEFHLMALSLKTLDLNNPADAREYVLGWIEEGSEGQIETRLRFEQSSDEEIMRVARQLFLHHDPRPEQGEESH